MGNNGSSSSGSSRKSATCGAVCVHTHSAPEIGHVNAIGMSKCIAACARADSICEVNRNISARGGVAAGDSTNNHSYPNNESNRSTITNTLTINSTHTKSINKFTMPTHANPLPTNGYDDAGNSVHNHDQLKIVFLWGHIPHGPLSYKKYGKFNGLEHEPAIPKRKGKP